MVKYVLKSFKRGDVKMVKKGDIILSVGIIVLAVACVFGFFLFKTEGKQVVITVDGEVLE